MIELHKQALMQALFLSVMAIAPIASASDTDDLTVMLHGFLAGASVGDIAAHETFWSDELVYTSSSGTRTNKANIIDGMRQAAAADDSDDSGPSTVYTAEEIEIDVYGTTAIVAFKLVGTPQDDSEDAVAYYFNTGTFLKRGGAWEVVAWQATRIPEAED